ncbi:hypothetical protein KC19_8G143600 [Ceratodon purpureus]|uniref:Uncharacterized protein n=1 Tax=Ceratodon purpureus TaxID=3225 RepID=A0A8T0H6Y1_CERPU|nr:hypothetical protein KC19_8G143600 [Ceratodon purpureus]
MHATDSYSHLPSTQNKTSIFSNSTETQTPPPSRSETITAYLLSSFRQEEFTVQTSVFAESMRSSCVVTDKKVISKQYHPIAQFSGINLIYPNRTPLSRCGLDGLTYSLWLF